MKNACKVAAILDGKPVEELPTNVRFVGMEKEPNKPPRYGELFHPWFNKPCYASLVEEVKT